MHSYFKHVALFSREYYAYTCYGTTSYPLVQQLYCTELVSLTSKILAVKIWHWTGGSSQHLQYLHVPACRREVQGRVALTVREIDRGARLHEHLHNVGLSCNDGKVEWRLDGWMDGWKRKMILIHVYSNARYVLARGLHVHA